jgi:Ribbon-helix-helix protein, copG family
MMPLMRTTVRVDDDLLERLKAQARKENVSLTRLLNRTLKAGLQAGGARPRKQPIFGERAHSMGAPRVALDKALALAATLEDEEIVRELALRK